MSVVETIEVSDFVKERVFEANPRRHFIEKEFAMCQHLIEELFKKGFLKKTLVPTDKEGEYLMTIAIRALKIDA